MTKVIVKQAENKPEIPFEVLADHIAAIGKAVKEMNATRLKRETLIILLCHITVLPKRDVKKVLDALDVLENVYLKPKDKK